MTAAPDPEVVEPVDSFRLRARAWLADNLPRGEAPQIFHAGLSDAAELAAVARGRALQRVLFDGGFAGICFPKQYGGLGLTPAHQEAFTDECRGYEMPQVMNVPTFVPCGAILVEYGTEWQKQRYLPAMLKGEQVWMQFLSEPSGGSDVAGALTSAVRDGDEWVVNGSKIWTTGAWWSDYALCLVRTNWDAPKHRGLTVFIVKIHQPNVDVHRIEMVNGSRDFCQEFMTDLRISDADRVGDVDDGWTVCTRWMFHERNAVSGGSPYTSGTLAIHGDGAHTNRLLALARTGEHLGDPVTRDLIGEAAVLEHAQTELTRRVGEAMIARSLPDSAAAIARLSSAVVSHRITTIGLDLAGPATAASEADDLGSGYGMEYLMRQTASIGGGTSEMARNTISERVLGMPRELTLDRDTPFRDVPKGSPAR